MTWTLRERGDTDGTVRLEYQCPVHGRFEVDVPRREAPDEMPCPLPRLYEIWPGDQVYVSVQASETPCTWEVCRAPSPWSPSGITGRVKPGEVVQGKVAEYPGAEHVMDTRALADGMPTAEFRARRAKVHRDIVIREMRKMTGRG